GFPGEEEEDFNDTIDIMEQVRFDSAFTFIYSPRIGTPAADWYDPKSREEVQERFERLVKLQNEHSLDSNLKMVGQVVEVLCEGESSADSEILSGRTADNRLVNFSSQKIGRKTRNIDRENGGNDREGEFISVLITNAKTFSLEGEEV
ncbi:MAG TPA: TRAM domain-containing protein, partial [Clostridiaceae bacterium]|nr:TRAM domain-containing protein [Clostridiaceae bacterium]